MTNEKELINTIDNFIKKWCGENSSHLLDNDENDGQKLKEAIISKLHSHTKEVVEKFLELADTQIRQKAIRYPEYIRGINKAGKDLKEFCLASLEDNKK